MNNKRIQGIDGVLDGLISSPDSGDRPQSAKPKRQHDGKAAKQGRPFGKRNSGKRVKKEKLTVRVPPDLAETYREWSWNARCSLSELVETAMQTYARKRKQER
jgi:hypothetical protein